MDKLREEARSGAKGKHHRCQRSMRGAATDVNASELGFGRECEGDEVHACSFLRANFG